MTFTGLPFAFIIFGTMMAAAIANPKAFPPYDGLARYDQHQGWWIGADYPFACPRTAENPRWTWGKKLCGGVHLRYWFKDRYVGGYADGNDVCRSNPWNRYSAWICR